MKVAYHAESIVDAQMVIDLLASQGVAAHLQGGYLSGAAGELPMGELLRVWVPSEQLGDAKRVLAERWQGGADVEPPEPPLERSWRRAWPLARGEGEALEQKLLAAWSEPQRKYHTLQHLEECVAIFEQHSELAEHPREVELALWFHDAVYEVKGKDNEARSAEWAVASLSQAGMPQAAVERVRQLVLATRHQALPVTPDEQLLVDIDLSILGAASERFDEYEVQVRQEYAWVPGAIFRRKRREVLESFLARPAIYSTPPLRAALEARARSNLERSLARLRPWYRFW